MSKPILIIDAGHGGQDSGGGSNEHWLEKEFVLEISKYQYKRFKGLGISVQLTRDDDIYLYSSQRAKIVRDSGAKYCISNHINAGGGEGAETIHSVHSDGKLAREILNELEKAGQKIRRAFFRTLSNSPDLDYYFMHRETGSVQTVIVEYGFADNERDTQRLLKNWKAYAESVVRGVCNYIGYRYEAPIDDNAHNWKYEGVKYLYEEELLNDLEGWKAKIDEPMPVWAVTLLLKKMHENLKGKGL